MAGSQSHGLRYKSCKAAKQQYCSTEEWELRCLCLACVVVLTTSLQLCRAVLEASYACTWVKHGFVDCLAVVSAVACWLLSEVLTCQPWLRNRCEHGNFYSHVYIEVYIEVIYWSESNCKCNCMSELWIGDNRNSQILIYWHYSLKVVISDWYQSSCIVILWYHRLIIY